MRTTIEMDPEHRARLLEIAARRGGKGFSGVVAEAIETYLVRQEALRDLQQKALLLEGSLETDEVATLRAETEHLRESWR